MTKLTGAAAFVEAEILVGRDMDEDTTLEVEGYVAWHPVEQEFRVSGIRVTRTLTWRPDGERPNSGDYEPEKGGGELRNPKEQERAKEALISEAEREHIGDCVACAREWGPRAKADGADWLCREHRERFAERKAA